jgi:hypothetical protein
MTDAFHKIWAIHKDKGCPLRVSGSRVLVASKQSNHPPASAVGAC